MTCMIHMKVVNDYHMHCLQWQQLQKVSYRSNFSSLACPANMKYNNDENSIIKGARWQTKTIHFPQVTA